MSSISDNEDGGLAATAVGTYVFLSYAAEDRPVAERVVRAVTSLGWHVWWDREIVPGKMFDERIGARLRSAGAVVVLWSRHSVASEWVREEASEAKRRDVLIPALIEQVEPPFGFTLRQAIDLTAWNGSSSAPDFGALAAALHAVLPAAVEPAPAARTDEQREPRTIWRHLPALLMLAALVAAGTGGMWYWDAYYRTHVAYFANVRTRNGLPEGVGPLDASQVARRNANLALVRHGRHNPVDEVRLVNSSGLTPAATAYIPTSSFSDLNPLASFDLKDPLASDAVTLTRVTFTRDAGGAILEQNWFTAAGRLVYTLRYANRDTAEYKSNGFTRSIRASGIAYLRFGRVESGPNAGLLEKMAFLDAAQHPQPTESGAYGYRVTFDERGLIRESFPLGPTLEDHPNNWGLFRSVRSHTELGDIAEEAYFDQKGARVADGYGIAIARSQYDTAGNVTQVAFFDRSERLVSGSAIGAARMDLAYDSHGRPTAITLFGVDERPVLGSQGFARKTLDWLTPTRVSYRFFGPKLDPTPVLGLAFEVVDTFDERGLPVEESFRDSTGAPTRIQNGCSTIQLAYDAVGNQAEVRCLNEGRRLTFASDGWSIVHSTYDERGNPVTSELRDPQGKPGNQADFYTSLHREYNAFGKISKETFLDAGGHMRKARSGFASVSYTYDRNGNRIEEAYFDEAGRPTAIPGGYAVLRSEFDGNGQELRTAFLSADGRPVRGDEGYAAVTREHDERGFISAVRFLDENGRPVSGVDGYSSTRRRRNADGRVLEMTYFDEHDAPVISKRPGSSRRRWTYDAVGRVVERSDYDANGRPMTNAYGYSTIRFSYDAFGRETGRQLLDVSSQPTPFKVMVEKVTSGSVAADAGFRAGDRMLGYDGERVETTYQFTNSLELFRGDRRREIRVQRGDQIIALDLNAGRVAGLELQERADR